MPTPDIIEYANSGDIKKVQECITNGDDINVTDHNGRTALILASRSSDQQIVELLIDANADLNVTTPYGWTALIHASDNGHQQVVTSLITAHADINVADDIGHTAVMRASMYEHQPVVESLIAAHADINMTDNYGWTALMNASESGKVECVKLLIQNKANLFVRSTHDVMDIKKGSSALDIAYNGNMHNTITELINAPDPDEINELHFYAAKGDHKMIKQSITKENDPCEIKQMIEARDRYGGKPADINESLFF